MIEMVQRYYEAERHFALFGVAIGATLVLIALILWRVSPSASLARGMAYSLLVAGGIQATASFGYISVVNDRVVDAGKIYSSQLESEIRQHELVRMRKVLRRGYTAALVTDTALLLVGIALIFAVNDAPKWKGVALALVIVGITGYCIEAYSMRNNRLYLQTVEMRR